MEASRQRIYDILSEVLDPEVPVLSVLDMGIVREVNVEGDQVEVVVTPTYSGCPATKVIEDQILAALRQAGYAQAKTRTSLFPPWTTDWMSEEGKRKLKEYGIAPPVGKADSDAFEPSRPVPCPFCGSADTQLKSLFGSTACKALFTCGDCRQPFEHFKCI